MPHRHHQNTKGTFMNKQITGVAATRRDFLTAGAVACMSGLFRGASAVAQTPAQAPPPVATSFKELRGGVGLFNGRGGTIGWFVSKEAVAVIDSQFPDMAKICLDGLNQRSSNRPLDCLILTHHHGDHTAGNGVFRPSAKKIVSHEKVPELMKMGAGQQPNAPAPTFPDTTFSSTWKAGLGQETVHARHYEPAHTGGDSVIFFEKANIVHMGDLVFNRRHPYIDKPAGASIAGWIRVLEKIAKDHSKDTIFIYGHAQQGWEVTGKTADLMAQRNYLTALLDHVRGEIKAGKSKETIVAVTDPLKGFSDHGPLIARVLQAAYEEITASK
jgi:cyclase